MDTVQSVVGSLLLICVSYTIGYCAGADQMERKWMIKFAALANSVMKKSDADEKGG